MYAWPWTATRFNVSVPLNGSMVTLCQHTVGSSRPEESDIQKLHADLRDITLNDAPLRKNLEDSSRWDNATWALQVQFHETESVCDWHKFLPELTRPGSLGSFALNGCLAFHGPEACELRFVPAFSFVVIVCNAIKVFCMFVASNKSREELLLTVGDGVSSFLDRPDLHTAGHCLLSKTNISQWSRPGIWARWKRREYDLYTKHTVPRVLPGRKRWWQAVSAKYWCTTFIMYVISSLLTKVRSNKRLATLGLSQQLLS